jgi:hypothetical protein
MPLPESDPLLPLSESYILDVCPNVTAAQLAELRQIVDHYLTGVLAYERASSIFIEKIHTDLPLQRISAILNVPQMPIQPRAHPPGLPSNATLFSRTKNHPWTTYEDQRLLYALHVYGVGEWGEVSTFVGNGRTRAQCSQRWFRGLDPRISRVLWTPEEEQKLFNLVRAHGERAWMKIASELGNRSDSQCRYHFHHMMKDISRRAELNGGLQIAVSTSQPSPCLEAMLPKPLPQCSSTGVLNQQQRAPLPSIGEVIEMAEQRKLE